MILKKEVISPKQPYFVMNTSQYYKAVVMNYGISHFYAFRRNRTIDSSIFAIPDGSIDIYFCCDKKIQVPMSVELFFIQKLLLLKTTNICLEYDFYLETVLNLKMLLCRIL